jgi:hypothetical protein
MIPWYLKKIKKKISLNRKITAPGRNIGFPFLKIFIFAQVLVLKTQPPIQWVPGHSWGKVVRARH